MVDQEGRTCHLCLQSSNNSTPSTQSLRSGWGHSLKIESVDERLHSLVDYVAVYCNMEANPLSTPWKEENRQVYYPAKASGSPY